MMRILTNPTRCIAKLAIFLVLFTFKGISQSPMVVGNGQYDTIRIYQGVQMASSVNVEFQGGTIITPRDFPSANFIFFNNAVAISPKDSSHINGYTELQGNYSFDFPCGSGLKYRPFTISSSSNTNTTHQGAYFNKDVTEFNSLPAGSVDRASKAPNIRKVSPYEYWDINGNGLVKLTFYWDAYDSLKNFIDSFEKIAIVGWNGTEWTSVGKDISIGNITAGSFTTPYLVPNAMDIYTFAMTNNPPTIKQDSLKCYEDSFVVFTPTLGGKDGPTDTLTVDTCDKSGYPKHGKIILLANGQFKYIPDSNYYGMDTVCVMVRDNSGASASVLVPIRVIPINDRPKVDDVIATIPEDSSIVLCLTVIDPDDFVFILSYCAPFSKKGTWVQTTTSPPCFKYIGNPDVNGIDTFCFVISDGNGGFDTGRAIIRIIPRPDSIIVRQGPVTTTKNTPVIFTPVIIDKDNPDSLNRDSLTFKFCNGKDTMTTQHGFAQIFPDGSIKFTPKDNFQGIDTVCIEVCPKNPWLPIRDCVKKIVPITIGSGIDKVVIANDDVISTNQGKDIDIVILRNDVILPDSVGLKISITVPPNNGNVVINSNGTITFTPNNGFTGRDSFKYTICIGTICDEAWVYIYVGQSVNAFTPNGDGSNDELTIPDVADDEGATVRVYNRWGDLIFLNTSGVPYNNSKFKGLNMDGDRLPDGTYFYIIKFSAGLNRPDKSSFVEMYR
jgi:gliding motility-associated-like protein